MLPPLHTALSQAIVKFRKMIFSTGDLSEFLFLEVVLFKTIRRGEKN